MISIRTSISDLVLTVLHTPLIYVQVSEVGWLNFDHIEIINWFSVLEIRIPITNYQGEMVLCIFIWIEPFSFGWAMMSMLLPQFSALMLFVNYFKLATDYCHVSFVFSTCKVFNILFLYVCISFTYFTYMILCNVCLILNIN